jgi:hypothetical protein
VTWLDFRPAELTLAQIGSELVTALLSIKIKAERRCPE